MKEERACRRHIVLLGVGHTNAHIVRMWAMNPLPDTDLTCISDSGVATYSGFLPAVLAGQIPPEAMEIDLVQLCAAAGARLITDRVIGMDQGRRQLLFAERPPVTWDVLSIGIGSVPTMPSGGADADTLVAIKPMRSFLQRLQSAIEACGPDVSSLQVVVVGGGAAGVEVSQCLPAQLKQLTSADCQVTLVNRNAELLPGCAAGTIRRVRAAIRRRGQTIRDRTTVMAVRDRRIALDDGTELPADLVIWATTAQAPPLLQEIDLPKDDQGFLRTRDTLQSTGADSVFVVGDTGSIEGHSVPRAGVYAVRQGPVLWDNLQRQLNGQPLTSYQPQASFLKLLNLGDGRAIGEWRGVSFSGRWVMKLKQRIDQRFMEMYQQLPDRMSMPDDMPCRGCGCKLAGDHLAQALPADDQRDDAAVLPFGVDSNTQSSDPSILITTDFFSSPFPDAWLTGRVAAIHAASDLYAMGAQPFAAEAIVVLPDGDPATQRQMLSDFQAGAAREFDAMGVTITGGHTITGPRFEVGFTVLGRAAGDQLIRKQGLQPDDSLYLTQPLGSGVLMAALMRGRCRCSDYQRMIETMLTGSRVAAEIAVSCQLSCGTDVTGFGLLGHLQEMLTEEVRAELSANAIPFLSGAEQAARQGITSSLLPSNRCYLQGVDCPPGPLQDLLLDPQTCGGLLLAVPPQREDRFRQQFADHGLPIPARIGRVTVAEHHAPRITVQGGR